MDTLVSHVAAARIKIPMPVVMRIVAALRIALRTVERPLRCRTAPQLVVNLLRYRKWMINLSNRRPPLVARADDVLNAPQLPSADIFDSISNRFARAPLCAALNNPLVFVRRVR